MSTKHLPSYRCCPQDTFNHTSSLLLSRDSLVFTLNLPSYYRCNHTTFFLPSQYPLMSPLYLPSYRHYVHDIFSQTSSFLLETHMCLLYTFLDTIVIVRIPSAIQNIPFIPSSHDPLMPSLDLPSYFRCN